MDKLFIEVGPEMFRGGGMVEGIFLSHMGNLLQKLL